MPFIKVNPVPALQGKACKALNFYYPKTDGPFRVGVQYDKSSWQDNGQSKGRMMAEMQRLKCYKGDTLGVNTPGPKVARALECVCTKTQLAEIAALANVQRIRLIDNP